MSTALSLGAGGGVRWPARDHRRWVLGGPEVGRATCVYAFWPSGRLLSVFPGALDADNVVALSPDEGALDPGAREIYPDQDGPGVAVVAAVCLGVVAAVYLDAVSGGRWHCGPEDLTARGTLAMEILAGIYGRPGVLVTFVRP